VVRLPAIAEAEERHWAETVLGQEALGPDFRADAAVAPSKSSPRAFGVVRDDPKVGAGRLVRLGATLFPITERAERDLIPHGKFLVGQTECAPKRLDARHASSRPHFFRRHRPRIGISCGWSLDLRLRHRPHRLLRKRPLAAVAQHFHDRAVSAIVVVLLMSCRPSGRDDPGQATAFRVVTCRITPSHMPSRLIRSSGDRQAVNASRSRRAVLFHYGCAVAGSGERRGVMRRRGLCAVLRGRP
jgi:hypothetical protein